MKVTIYIEDDDYIVHQSGDQFGNEIETIAVTHCLGKQHHNAQTHEGSCLRKFTGALKRVWLNRAEGAYGLGIVRASSAGFCRNTPKNGPVPADW